MRPRHCFGLHRSVLGLFMAVLALLGQISFAPAALSAAARPDTALPGDIAICHSGTPAGLDDGAPPGHAQHGTHCALCPACHALAVSAFLPTPATQPLSPPLALCARHAWPPPARAPPVIAVRAATYPTGPPSLA